jgi:hypothetical protein
MKDPESWDITMRLEVLNLSGNKQLNSQPKVDNNNLDKQSSFRHPLRYAHNFLRTTIVIFEDCKPIKTNVPYNQEFCVPEVKSNNNMEII